LLQKSQAVQQIEIQLRTYASMVDDLNRRNTELTSANEKHRIAAAAAEKNAAKLAEAEREAAALRRDNKEREERLLELQGREKAHRLLEEANGKLKKEREEAVVRLQERTKENKSQALQLEERGSRIAQLEQELAEMEESSERSKERSEKMDRLMRENNRLNAALMEKVNDIEKLQYRLNNLDNRFSNAQAELQRARLQLEETQQNEKAFEVEAKDLRERYEAETATRLQLEDRLLRGSQDLLANKFALAKMAEEHAEQLQLIEKESARVEEEMAQLREELQHLHSDKQETQGALLQAQAKIDALRTEVGEFSW
jgi:A-kinase anchor protein 9